MVRETEVRTVPGLPMLTAGVAGVLLTIGLIVWTAVADAPVLLAIAIPLLLASAFVLAGLTNIGPNQARVLQLFGEYKGTAKQNGLRWASPFYTKRTVSLRTRNFESGKLKVNDRDGSPVEIAAIVVWKVADTAEALFEVEDYQKYVHVQSEAALRNLATRYPYDDHTEVDHAVAAAVTAADAGSTIAAESAAPSPISLRGSSQEVADELKREVRERLAKAGIEVVEARISHLAYASEIAGAMLRRQQAGAIIAARQKIVEGAVGMVEMALEMLARKQVVELDNDRKAAMVSNLLVVLCGEHDAQPVLNTGTIYQ